MALAQRLARLRRTLTMERFGARDLRADTKPDLSRSTERDAR